MSYEKLRKRLLTLRNFFKNYNESLSYDKNGNITALQRNGEYEDNVTQLQTDNLNYFYPTNSNRLMKVTDATNTPSGFKDDSNGTNDTVDDYSYDANGNMITDQNKAITSIKYNHLNLPTEIIFSGTNRKINYLYNANGTKKQKMVTRGTLITTTDYLDSFQYVNTVLEFFPTAEGYVKSTISGTSATYNYVFNYTDHLGNVRLSYGYGILSKGNYGLFILQENNYYPFGLQHNGYNMTKYDYDINNTKGGATAVIINTFSLDYLMNKYKFNGKELDEETGLYYYGARYFDPRTSIWLSIDPLAEVNPHKSPYNYCSNNPINRTDPTGMLDDWYIDQNGAYLGQDGSTTNNIRMINRVDYNDISEANGGTTSEAATQQLQSGSQAVTVDDAQIQGMMQGIHSATNSVENQMYIVLDKSNATIKGVLGAVGKDGEATIDSFTRSRQVDGVEQQIPGLFAKDADGKNWPLLGQVHTHNLIKGSSTGTGSSTTLGGSTTENGFGTSAQDVETAKSLGIPIYAIDSWNYGPRGQATIGRVLPNGTQTSGVGTTAGSRGQTNASSVNVGTEALNYRVTGNTTR